MTTACSGESRVAGAEPWLAAFVLLLVAALAYACGRLRGGARRSAGAAAARSALDRDHERVEERAAVARLGLPPVPGAFVTTGERNDESAGAASMALAASDIDSAAHSPIVQALLAAHPGAALLAQRDAHETWRCTQSNGAARALWPRLEWPPTLDAVRALLPPAVASAVKAASSASASASRAAMQTHIDADSAAATGGWQAVCVGFDAAGAPSTLLLVQHATAAAHAAAAEGDNFSFTASHDLRAPIRVVEGFTRIVKEDYGHLLDRVGNDHLDRVLGAAARMNLMIDALLTLARLSQQPLARQPVNLTQLAGFIVDDLKRGEPGRDASVEIEPELSATGDPTLLRLVLENLIGNAWKYSAQVSRAQISLHTVPHNGALAYCVRDNGAGFDMRSADRLFGLFQRLHSASEFPGHGVGLASVRRIVHRHGGEIWAESEPGRGAAFFFTLAA